MISYSKHGLFSPLLLCHLTSGGRSRWKRVSRLKKRWKAEWDSFRWCECDRKRKVRKKRRGRGLGLDSMPVFRSSPGVYGGRCLWRAWRRWRVWDTWEKVRKDITLHLYHWGWPLWPLQNCSCRVLDSICSFLWTLVVKPFPASCLCVSHRTVEQT